MLREDLILIDADSLRLRLADDAVTVRELLAHTGGVDSPPPAELAAEALRPQGPRRDAVEETGLGWGLRRSMDAVGQAGIGPGWAASLILRPSTGRTIAVLTNRLFPVLALNAELVRSAT